MSVFQLLPYFFIILILQISLSIFTGNSPPSPSLYAPVDNFGYFDNTQHPLNLLSKPRKSTLGFGVVNTVATVVTILLTLLNILVCKLRQIQESNLGENFKVSSSSPPESRRFLLAEIKSATNDFDDSLVIGQGGFGKVYKGSIDNGAKIVAIKRLNSLSKQGAPEFWTEISMLSKFRHSHLVSLIGYCDSYNELVLVYEYMARGTLGDHLYKIGKNGNNNVPLCWVQRLNISIGAARGLEYLHTGTGVKARVIHRDVKSSNILLDEHLTAKISDFGLSIIGPANQSCTDVIDHAKGTMGYLDPAYILTNRLTRKSDVYSFGVVLFELLSGRPAGGYRLDQDQHRLAGWAQECVKQGTIEKLIDPELHWEIKSDSFSEFVKIADQCLHLDPKKRPTMSEVVTALELVLKLQERRDYSMVEEYSFNDGGEASTGQEIVDSSTNLKDCEVKDCGHLDKKIVPSSGLGIMKWTRKIEQFFLVTPRPRSGLFSIKEIMDWTNNFNERLLIGVGVFGRVYRGALYDGTRVAIKRHDPESRQGLAEFQTEIKMSSKLGHHHIISLIGYCDQQSEMILVYEYMANGSLRSHLYGTHRPPLSWKQRLEICIGAARALHYLHTREDRGIIHRDIKTTHILLDDNFVAKVGDFGLAKMGPAIDETHVSTIFDGTIGYLDPEYCMTQQLTEKCDVYSFGVVLMETLCARPAISPHLPGEHCNMVKWAMMCQKRGMLHQIMDRKLVGKVNQASLNKFGETANKCLADRGVDRPSMGDVLQYLEFALQLEETLSALMEEENRQ